MKSVVPKHEEWGYLVIWEFQVCPGMERHFEKVYGSNGDWARLFGQDESYIATQLVRELKAGRTYLSLDFWISQESYDAFRRQHLAEYKSLDRKCEKLTESEREIGRFVRISKE
jgi:heme-degrading monooxygenase HmoA